MSLESVRAWRRTKRGLITNLYSKMRSRHETLLSLDDLHNFSNCKKFDRLFDEWVRSGYNKQFKPSIDRISNKKGYINGNIQWITWAENRFKQNMERRSRNGPVLQMMGNKVIARFKSQREAVIKTGIPQGNMSSVLTGKREYCGGYKFIYENPELSES